MWDYRHLSRRDGENGPSRGSPLSGELPLRELVTLRLGPQRLEVKLRDRSMARSVRPQRHGPIFTVPEAL